MSQLLKDFYPGGKRYAGQYETSPNQVLSINHDTKEQRVVLNPTPPGPQSDSAMRDQDGNGRLGRALFLMALLHAEDLDLKTIIEISSIDRQIEKHRPLYYKVLQQTSGGFYKPDSTQYKPEQLASFFYKC